MAHNHDNPRHRAARACCFCDGEAAAPLLCLDCAELGPLHARVELSGNRLGTTLWAEREGTLQAARAAVGELEEALRAQGVEVSRVDCRHGRPPESAGLRFGNLLDVRT